MIFVGVTRYRVPWDFLLALLAAATLVALARRLRDARPQTVCKIRIVSLEQLSERYAEHNRVERGAGFVFAGPERVELFRHYVGGPGGKCSTSAAATAP